nr:leucine-rich repeat protein [Eubacterium sp.]
MQKICKKVLSCLLVFALSLSLIPVSDGIGLEKKVAAATDPSAFPNSKVVDTTIIQDVKLLNALKRIIGNDNLTFGELKAYDGEIDLSNDTEIGSVKGLGYALNASKINLSTLTKIKKIEKEEFKSCAFTNLTLPSSITEISGGAFSYCSNLKTINLPAGLKIIGNQAFQGCTVLDDITLPSGIERIGNDAFSSCKSLSEIVIPNGINAASENSSEDALTGIGINAFNGCSNLSKVTIGSGMTAIPVGFLQGTTSLHEIKIPSAIMAIRENAFYESGIFSLDLSKNTNLSVISKGAFASCALLQSINLPSSIVKIESNGFANCISVTDSSFLEPLKNLKEIGSYAFKKLGAKEVVLPGNVEILGEGAFFDAAVETFEMKDYLAASTSDRCKSIGALAFKDCIHMTTFKFPLKYENDSKTSITIGQNAFENCVVLDNIRFPLNLRSIGDYAFKNCGESYTDWDRFGTGDRGTSYYIEPEYVHETNDAEGLTKVELCTNAIPAFYKMREGYIDYSHLSSFQEDPSQIYVVLNKSSLYGPKIYKQYITGISSIDLSSLKNLKIGKGVFTGCVNLREAWMPSDLKELPDETFAKCATPWRTSLNSTYSNLKSTKKELPWYYGLKSVHLPNCVTKIGAKAFQECYEFCLNKYFPSSLKEIGNNAFEKCESMGDVVMPQLLEKIGDSAFAKCSRIVDSHVIAGYGMTDCDLRSASKIRFIGARAFNACSFKTFLMNTEAPVVEILSNTFDDCQWMNTIRLANKVEYVGANAFKTCGRLETVEITDACILDGAVCTGKDSVQGKMYNDLAYVTVYNHSSGQYDIYIVTNTFKLSIRQLSEELTARQNTPYRLPLKTAVKSDYNTVEEIKIGGVTCKFGADGKPLESVEGLPLQPEVVAEKYSFKDNERNMTITNELLRGVVTSDKASEDNPVEIKLYMNFPIDSQIGTILVVSNASYTVDVTANPCQRIDGEDEYFLNYSSTSALTIKPDFVPTYDDSEITDIIEWELKSGADDVNMEVVDNGKSVKVTSKQNNFGTAVLVAKAGNITREFPVHLVAPIIMVSMPYGYTKRDMMVSSSDTLSVNVSYPTRFENEKELYPDKVTFTSSNPNVVSVTEQTVINGKPQCKLTALSSGTAVITARSKAGNASATCSISVSSKDLKVNFKDSEDNPIAENSTINLYGGDSKSMFYTFSEVMNSSDLLYEVADPSMLSVSVDKYTNKVSIRGKKSGSTTVTLYPMVGTKEANGVTFNVRVYGTINSISLSTKTIALGNTDSIFSSLGNSFNERITEATEANYKLITDNEIVFETNNPECATVDHFGNVTVTKLPENMEPIVVTCSAYRNEKLMYSKSTTVTPEKAMVQSITYSGNTAIGIGKTGVIQFGTFPVDTIYKSATISLPYESTSVCSYTWDEKTLTLKVTGKKK